MNPPVIIIGAGLSGLYTAYRLARHGIDCQLLEARNRLGGRIVSHTTNDAAMPERAAAVDLGPSWFWPHQQRMLSLIEELALSDSVYWQLTEGNAVMEYPDGTITRGYGGAAMADSHRLSGGLQQFVHQLSSRLNPELIQTEAIVTDITRTESGLVVSAEVEDSREDYICQHAVIALPPRVVANTVNFTPALSGEYSSKLQSVPTWMAAQAKFVAVYENPFWLQQGLSGDGMSQLGPLVEIHDASPESGGPYALFGFVGVPAKHREQHSDAIQQAAIVQITRMFGDAGSRPLKVYYKDWAFDRFTATEQDRVNAQTHAMGDSLLESFWNERVLWVAPRAPEIEIMPMAISKELWNPVTGRVS